MTTTATKQGPTVRINEKAYAAIQNDPGALAEELKERAVG